MTGFVLVDLDGATAADGVVRSAKKILLDGARTLARSRTYAWALMGQEVSGASAGVNVTSEHHDAGMAAFTEAVLERVRSGELSLDPAKGVTAADVSSLQEVDRRSALRNVQRAHGSLSDELLATGVVAAASAALGGMEGRRVAIEGAGDALPALLAVLGRAGAVVVAVSTPNGTVVDAGGLDTAALSDAHREHGDALTAASGSELGSAAVLTTEAEVLMCGSKAGLVDHEVAQNLPHRLIAPIGPVPVTAKGLAVASRRDVVVLPDFLTTAGPLHAFRADDSATAEDVLGRADEHATTLTSELLDHPEGPVIGACLRAEDFLRTWQDTLPFGRPLA